MKNYLFPHSPKKLNRGAFQIASFYLLIGGLWILVSDQVAARIALDKGMLTTISLYKGWGYVLVTSLLLYWLIKRHTAALSASRFQLQTIIDAFPALISYIDPDRTYRFTNRTYREWFGNTTRGKRIEEVIGDSAFQKVSKYVDKALAGETVTFESLLPYPMGERFVSATYIPDVATDGRVQGLFALVQDLTERKQTQEERQLWADAFEGCAHGIAVVDPQANRIMVCNPAFAALHKSRVEEVMGSAMLSLYALSSHEWVRRNVQKADQIGHSRFEALMVRRDGSTFPVQMDLISVLDNDGELLYRVATAQDITERKQTEETNASLARFPAENPNPILRATHEGKILYANAASEPLLRDWGVTVGDALPEDWIQIIAGLIRNGSTTTIDVPSGKTTYSMMIVYSPDADDVNIYGRDITEQKQAEENLRRFELLSEHSRDMILFMGAEDGRILEANAAAVQAYGYSRAKLLTLTIADLRAENTLPLARAQMAEAEARGILFETLHRRKDGSIFPVEVSSQGATIGGLRTLISIVRDITKRRQAEEELRLKDQLLHLTSEMAKVGGWEFDPETGEGTWTDEVARIHDLDPSQETNLDMGLSFYSGVSRERVQRAVKEAIELARPYDLELEMTTATGAHKWIRTIGLPVVQDGTVVKVQGIFQDITARKQIEQALRAAHDELERKVQERTAALSEANALLQALMDYMPDQIYFKDTQSRFIRNSRSQASMLGLKDPAEAVGKTDFDFFPHAAQAFADEQEIMRTGTPRVDFEEWVVWPDGKEMWVSTTKVPLRSPEGQIIGIFGISHDITGRKRAEQAIRELNADLERQAARLQAANQELEAFSYSVSHDLRAPLRAIDGYTRILVQDYEASLDAEGKRICGVISREARRMGQLIDDLLAFSRLGRKEMFTSGIDMKDLVASVFDELLRDQDRSRIELQIAKLPPTKGDRGLMHQVWVNLLSNAIKFTSKKVQAVIEVGGKQNRDENIYYVRDNGAGFDMEYANKLFGVFQRLHGESEFEGTGVGLAIVQRIIRRHGGRIWAAAEVEKGATFYFALPRKENTHE